MSSQPLQAQCSPHSPFKDMPLFLELQGHMLSWDCQNNLTVEQPCVGKPKPQLFALFQQLVLIRKLTFHALRPPQWQHKKLIYLNMEYSNKNTSQCIEKFKMHFSSWELVWSFYWKKVILTTLFNYLFLFPKARLEHNLIFTEFYFEFNIEK